MNILLIGDNDNQYGSHHTLCQLAEKLKSEHINVTVVIDHESDLAKVLREKELQVIIVHYAPFYHEKPENAHFWLPVRYIYRGIKYTYGRIFALHEIEKKVDINKIDLIHSNSSRVDLGALIALKHNIPLIWHIREFSQGHFQCYSYRQDYIALMNKTASKFVAISNAVKEHWIGCGIDPKKVERIYDGVARREKINARVIPLKRKDNLRLAFVGRLSQAKGQEQAIKMMYALKKEGFNVQLDLIGDGSILDRLRTKRDIKKYHLKQNVKMLGYQKNIYDLLPTYDIGVMCSKCEGFGLVTAEYMMAGLPVLAARSGANVELVRDGVDGYLYELGDIDDMKSKLLRIVDENLGGETTQKWAMKMFSEDKNTENIVKVYKKVLGKK